MVAIVIVSSAYLLCRDGPFFGSLKNFLARSIVLFILCHDNLMCVYWNSCDIDNCVATLFLCSFFKFVSRPSFYVVTVFLLVLIETMFLVLSVFPSRLGKSIATESCLHVTQFLVVALF